MKRNASLLLLIACGAIAAPASDWPQWRGPQRDGKSAGLAWPDKLDTNHLRRLWRVELGPSYSGPIAGGDRVFTTETNDKNVLTPVVHADILYTSTYGGKTIGYKVAHYDGKWTVNEAWRHKAQGYMSTPVVIDGVAYNHLKSQRLMAIEVGTGRELWTSDKSYGKYWSLVAQGDRILGLDQRGTLYLQRANQEKLDIIDQRKIADAETWAHLAVAGDQLFIRELNALSAWQFRRPAL